MRKGEKKQLTNLCEYKKQLKGREQHASRELANGEYLASFKEVIYGEYRPENVSLYRWMHNPNCGDDFLPQIFQEASSMSVDMLEVPSANASKDAILEYASWFTLSHFVSLEDAVKAWRSNLDKILKKEKQNKRDKLIQRWIKKKGQYVMKIDYTEDSGLVGQQDNGVHKEVFPFQGVDIASLIDKELQPFKIEIR